MITDYLNTFADKQAITASAVSQDTLDLGPLYPGNTRRDIGAGNPVYFVASVGTAFTAGTSLQVTLETSDDDTTYVPLMTSGAVALAQLTQGAVLMIGVVPRGVRRYLRASFTAVGTFGAGTVNAMLVETPQDGVNVLYAAGYKIDK